ncbi:MAG: hypothetical protein K2H64_03830 [Desulfovibrio sp.]|nr:hypothetical protein [Desulfovibrio sp.]
MTLDELKTYLEKEFPVVEEDGMLLVTVTNVTGEAMIFYVEEQDGGFTITESAGTVFGHCLSPEAVKNYLERCGTFPAA